MAETWKPHPKWAHLNISTLGTVVNTVTGNVVGTGRSGRGRYHAVAVAWDPVRRQSSTAYVHTLVLETFVGPRPEGHDGDHEDHDRSNNAVSNLRWRPVSENRSDITR